MFDNKSNFDIVKSNAVKQENFELIKSTYLQDEIFTTSIFTRKFWLISRLCHIYKTDYGTIIVAINLTKKRQRR